MTPNLSTPQNSVRIACDQVSTVSVDEVFVSVNSPRAYVVHSCPGGGLHWNEVSLRVAELLVALGARAEVGSKASLMTHHGN